MPLNGKGLMGVKENEKTLVRREYNKRADLRKAEDCNWCCIYNLEDCRWQEGKKPEEASTSESERKKTVRIIQQ